MCVTLNNYIKMNMKYKRLIITILVSCMHPLAVNSHEDWIKETDVIQVDVSDVLDSDYPDSPASIANADDLSFQYYDGKIIEVDSEGLEGNKNGGLEDVQFAATNLETGEEVTYEFVWKAVVISEDSDSVSIGLEYYYDLMCTCTLSSVPGRAIMSLDPSELERGTIPLGDFPLRDSEVSTHAHPHPKSDNDTKGGTNDESLEVLPEGDNSEPSEEEPEEVITHGPIEVLDYCDDPNNDCYDEGYPDY